MTASTSILLTAEPTAVRIDGREYLMQRIQIADLEAWRTANHLRPAGSLGGPNTWPPVIRYEPITEESCPKS